MNTRYLLLFAAAFLTLQTAPAAAAQEQITLDTWECTLDTNRQQIKAVLWDTPVEKGGMGIHHDGFGTYRTSVAIPESMKQVQLAFFISSIDDADETYFNGVKIGGTGKFPMSPDSDDGCRSGVRLPRLYIIPQNSIRYGAENELQIHVFNFAGSGGLNGNTPPVIAPVQTLAEK
ncbi:MAG: hypothetical protein ACRCUT_05070, partial [Spirochaetota bacterium]